MCKYSLVVVTLKSKEACCWKRRERNKEGMEKNKLIMRLQLQWKNEADDEADAWTTEQKAGITVTMEDIKITF